MAGRTASPAPDFTLIAVLPVAAVVTADDWDKGGATILFANREFCELTGYRAADLTGRNTRLLHGPRTNVARLRQGGLSRDARGQGQGEGWLSRKDGKEFYARWRFGPLVAGGPLVFIYHDHTELWRQREALLRSQKLSTVGLLAGGMAHDFNNLLSIINGYCEILAPKLAPEAAAARKDLNEIHRAGLKASAIARQILEFNRRQGHDAGVVNFNTLIREIAEIIRRVCGENIEVQLRLASDLGNARINPVHFQQVLLNLCFNARDAMPRGGQLMLRTFNRPAEAGGHGQVALEVTDTGTGISPTLRKRIFEPFYTTKAEGTGLGLPTAQGLIVQAGGRLAMRSEPGRGTTFEVFLPETAEPEDTGAMALGVLPATRGTETVLLVESDEGLRKMIAGILAIDGYSVSAAASVEEAARLTVRPQLVIADTSARKGLASLKQLAAADPRLRLISTAPEKPALPVLASARGAHLPKPFALSALLTRVRALLDAPERA